MHRIFALSTLFFFLFTTSLVLADGIKAVIAGSKTISILADRSAVPFDLVELQPFESIDTATREDHKIGHAVGRRTTVPRFANGVDRLYSGFVAIRDSTPVGAPKFVTEFHHVANNEDSYPKVTSKKGLQVQMIDDAIVLGVKHAALNVDLGRMAVLKANPDDIAWLSDGKTFRFSRSYVEHLDSRVQPLSGAKAVVTFILLNYKGPDAEKNAVLLHPKYDNNCPQDLSAFNTSTADGCGWFKASVEFLAARYSADKYPHGRVANYIVGNEVNSHWSWANMGHVDMETFARDYARTVRICNTAVRKFSSTARTFISLEHHWNIRYPPYSETQAFRGKAFIDYFNSIVKESGDFDWNLAFHPYPENLFNPRTWEDKSAKRSFETPRITFKNIDLLTQYFRRAPLLYQRKPRHIILSEQGFHSDGTPEGERVQAAAYCYAYYKVAHLDGIDAFILHRHVDHPHEGGLNLGLWRRSGDSAEPLSKKPIYDVFRLADTPDAEKAFKFALPVIGVTRWKDILGH